jgi:hypothetical protein
LNRLWHSRLPKLTSPQHRVSFAAEFDGHYYAAAIWCRPIAGNRMAESQYEVMELQRFAIAPDAPKNTASRLLAVMAREIRRGWPEIRLLISYQDLEVHRGTIYRAAGWTPTVTSEGREWDTVKRSRKKTQSAAPKQRWEKVIRQAETRDARPAPKPEQGPTLFDWKGD